MTRCLRLIPEIQCWPTWLQIGESHVFDNVDPFSIGISNSLAVCLRQWSDRWDETYDMANDPGNPKFPTADDERAFWHDGAELANRLRRELGENWNVEYEPGKVYASALTDQ